MKYLIVSSLFILFLQPFLFRFAEYEARENDSRLYTRFVGQLESRPLREMIALEWRNYSPYQDANSPYVRDHLIGQFIPSVLLAKIGWDPNFVHYVVNQIYRLLIPWLMFLFALQFMNKEYALLPLLACHLNIMGLNYGLRANQEQALLFGFFLSLYGFSRFEKIAGKMSLFTGSVFAFLVKGLVGLLHFPAWVLWVLLFSKKKKKHLIAILLTGALILISAGIYEWWFFSITGQSFWKGYYEIQIIGREKSGALPFSSIFYYIKRSISYALPWILGVFWLIKNKPDTKEKDFYWLCFLLSLGLIVTFGYFNRHASRYIFPVYFLFSSLGILGWRNLKFLKEKVSQLKPIFVHLALYWAIFFVQYGIYLYKGKTYVNY